MMGKIKKKEEPMKTKLTQLAISINKIDRRYIQYAYFVFMLAMFALGSPDDGSGGTLR
jgi:hypothetical protein